MKKRKELQEKNKKVEELSNIKSFVEDSIVINDME